MERALALQLAELRRPRARALLPRELEYKAALEKMEAEGKIPTIKNPPRNSLPKLKLNHGRLRDISSHI